MFVCNYLSFYKDRPFDVLNLHSSFTLIHTGGLTTAAYSPVCKFTKFLFTAKHNAREVQYAIVYLALRVFFISYRFSIASKLLCSLKLVRKI